MWSNFLLQPIGALSSLYELAGDRELHRSSFFNEWLLPQDIVVSAALKVMVAGSSHWALDVGRGRGRDEFDARERAMMLTLSPHLRRASEIGRTIDLERMTGPWLAGPSLGLVVVDEGQRIVSLNDAAQTILERPGCPLSRHAGRLRLTGPRGDKLARFVQSACSGQDTHAPLGGEMRATGVLGRDPRFDLALSVGPYQSRGLFVEPLATILMRELTPILPATFPSTASAIFGLTATEARLATSLAEGRTLKEAAAHQHIGIRTARTHLERIFRKTETRQQSELVATMRTLRGLAEAR